MYYYIQQGKETVQLELQFAQRWPGLLKGEWGSWAEGEKELSSIREVKNDKKQEGAGRRDLNFRYGLEETEKFLAALSFLRWVR